MSNQVFLEIGNSKYKCRFCKEPISIDNKTYKYKRWGKEKICPHCNSHYVEVVDMTGRTLATDMKGKIE